MGKLKGMLFAAISIILMVSISYAADDYMQCQSGMGVNGTVLFRYYSITNAHGEEGYHAYSYRTACGLEGLRNDSGLVILKLSNLTNAHASDNSTTYPYNVYADYDYGYLTCSFKSSCEWYESCIISLSNLTNAHMESCSENNYPYRLCCYATDTTNPEIWFENPTPPSPTYSNNSYVMINVSVNDSSYLSSLINFNNSLFLYLPMDEGYGSIAYDRSGNGRNGTLNGDVQWTFGKFGKALFFDGVDDYVIIDAKLNASSFSVSAWVKNLSNPNPWVSIVNEYPTSLPRWVLRLDSFQVANSTTTVDCLHGNSSVYDGNWHLLTGVWNGSALRIYLDGQLQNECQGPTGLIEFQRYIKVGENVDSGSDYHGWIDEVRIFTYPLSDQEIKAIYDKSYQLYRNFTGLGEGIYDYYAYTIDMSGNFNTTETRRFVSDRTPPESSITSPPNNSMVNLTVLIETETTDNLSPIDVVELWIDNQYNQSNNTANATFLWNTSHFVNGDHYLKLRVCDKAGNCGFSGIYHYVINNTMYVDTNVTNEIDVDGTSTAVIWANATRNDGTVEDDTQVESATVEIASTKYSMSWNSSSSRWEYVANNSILGLPIGDNSYRINITDIMNITGIRDYFIHVDDINITVYNLSYSYYSFDDIWIRVVTKRVSNDSLIPTTVNASLINSDGVAYSNKTDIDGDDWVYLKAGCSNSNEVNTLKVYANSTWLDELYINSTVVKPIPTQLDCGFDPEFLDWDYSDTSIRVWCRFRNNLTGESLMVDELNVSITDGSSSISHPCEGFYTLSDFSWNSTTKRYEMKCSITSSDVPDACYDLSLEANATKNCHLPSNTTSSQTTECRPIIDAAWIEPGYIDVDHSSEVYFLKANITDYDGYSEISAKGRRIGFVWTDMAFLSSSSPYTATYYTTIPHESNVVCFYGEVNASDAYHSVIAQTSNQGCGEDIYSIPLDGCNQTVEWGNTVTFSLSSNYSTDNAGVVGNGECFLYNSSLIPEERDHNSTSINGLWDCGITPSFVSENTTFFLGVNASGTRESLIDEKEIFDYCWLNVTLRSTNLTCTYPELADIYSEIEINCTYTDSIGGLDGATLSINFSSLCETTMDWTSTGNGNYTYRCILEEPGVYNFTVKAEKTGYVTSYYSNSLLSRYIERENEVVLAWENPENVQIFTTAKKINYYSTSDVESPFVCVVDNSTTSGIAAIGNPEYIYKSDIEVYIAQKELSNQFVIPVTDASCQQINSKMKTFLQKGYVSSPFSGNLQKPSSYNYYVVYESPIPINSTVRIGRGIHNIQIRNVNGTLVVR